MIDLMFKRSVKTLSISAKFVKRKPFQAVSTVDDLQSTDFE